MADAGKVQRGTVEHYVKWRCRTELELKSRVRRLESLHSYLMQCTILSCTMHFCEVRACATCKV